MRRALKPFIVGLAVIFAGSFIVTYFNIYDHFPYIDKIFHFSGGFIIAWFFAVLWVDYLKHASPFQKFLTLLGLAAFVGVLWELAEYSTSLPSLVDFPLLRHYFYIGTIADSFADLIADILGATLAALILRFK